MTLQTPPQSPGDSGVLEQPGASRSRRIQALVVVLALLLLAGITLAVVRLATGSDDPEPSSQTPVTTVAPAASATVNTEQAVLETYRRSGEAFEEATSKADPNLPALALYKNGEALREAKAYITGLRANGLVARGTTDLQEVRVLAIDGTSATVRARGCDRGFKYDATTGQMRDSPEVVRFEEEATLTPQPDGTWKVSRVTGQRTGTCAG